MLGINQIEVCYTPLINRGDYDWYDLSGTSIASGISLVVCDGPPSATRGGRFGLLPEIWSLLAPDAVILIDDMERPAEQEMLAAWLGTFGGRVTQHGTHKPYAVYRPRP